MTILQSIETAPKDGSVIWAWSPKAPDVMRRVRWSVGRFNRVDPAWITADKGCVVTWRPTYWLAASIPDGTFSARQPETDDTSHVSH